MPARIVYLDRYEITATQLHALRERPVSVCVNLKSHDLTPAVIRLPPNERKAYRVKLAERWLDAIERALPGIRWRRHGPWTILTELRGSVRADQVRTLRGCRGVDYVVIKSIRGLRRKPAPKPPRLEWFCVHGRVAVQIEGQQRGMQTVDDQYVVVKATGIKDAARRAKQYWRRSQVAYLNPRGELVRWKLESVEDVVRTYVADLDPRGEEVYSNLTDRRIRPEHIWRPRG